MLRRSIQRVAPTWTIREAANGETALSITDTETFDLIFVDQYMASVEKQLLGTETVQAMRAKGVTSRLCGLSANDLASTFEAAGADFFLQKPFSTNQDDLRNDLFRVLGV